MVTLSSLDSPHFSFNHSFPLCIWPFFWTPFNTGVFLNSVSCFCNLSGAFQLLTTIPSTIIYIPMRPKLMSKVQISPMSSISLYESVFWTSIWLSYLENWVNGLSHPDIKFSFHNYYLLFVTQSTFQNLQTLHLSHISCSTFAKPNLFLTPYFEWPFSLPRATYFSQTPTHMFKIQLKCHFLNYVFPTFVRHDYSSLYIPRALYPYLSPQCTFIHMIKFLYSLTERGLLTSRVYTIFTLTVPVPRTFPI